MNYYHRMVHVIMECNIVQSKTLMEHVRNVCTDIELYKMFANHVLISMEE